MVPVIFDYAPVNGQSGFSAGNRILQDLAFAKMNGLGRRGEIEKAGKYLDAIAVLFQIGAELALAVRGDGGVGKLDVINIFVLRKKDSYAVSFLGMGSVPLRHKVESCISLFKRQAVQLVTLGVQRKLME